MIIKYKKNLVLYVLMAFMLGAIAGGIVWTLLFIMNSGIELLWHKIPENFGDGRIYTLCMCLAGGLLIGLWQKKYGIYPDELEEVIYQLRTKGTYPYDKIPVLAVAALLPLIFGGCLGPEAGLTGIIVGLCCWVGDRLKYKSREIREIAEAGMAASLGVIFASPFAGLAFNYESSEGSNPYEKMSEEEKDVLKRLKKFVYIVSVVGGMGAMKLLSVFFGGGSGFPRFDRDVDISVDDWKWFIVVFAAGLVAGLLYMVMHKMTVQLGERLKDKRIISCLLAGLSLAVIGIISPWTMFSGEHQMGELMHVWQNETAAGLIGIAVLKLILVKLCINLGWRGGHIFPVIFSGVALGYAMSMILGIEPVFAVAVTTATLCGYTMRKPVMAIGILMLCFPVTVIIPLALAAYLGSVIPVSLTKSKN